MARKQALEVNQFNLESAQAKAEREQAAYQQSQQMQQELAGATNMKDFLSTYTRYYPEKGIKLNMDLQKASTDQRKAWWDQMTQLATVMDNTPENQRGTLWQHMVQAAPSLQGEFPDPASPAFGALISAIHRGNQKVASQWLTDEFGNVRQVKVDDKTGDVLGVNKLGQYGKPSSKTALTVGPDGSVTFLQGAGQNNLAKPTENDAQKQLMDSAKMVSQLTRIDQAFKPEYQTYLSRGKALGLSVLAKINPDSLDDNQKGYLTDFSKFKKRSWRMLNDYINKLSGAAVSPDEAKRLIAALPNPGTGLFDGDDPYTFITTVRDTMYELKLAAARNSYALKNGMDPFTFVIDEMPQIMETREKEIEAVMMKNGLQGKALDDAVLRAMTDEFGIRIQ